MVGSGSEGRCVWVGCVDWVGREEHVIPFPEVERKKILEELRKDFFIRRNSNANLKLGPKSASFSGQAFEEVSQKKREGMIGLGGLRIR